MIEERFVDVDGVRTRYKLAGDGPPAVMIHGGEFGRGAGADAWPDELWEGYIDRLGQAMTAETLDPSDYTMSAVVRHAERLLRVAEVSGAENDDIVTSSGRSDG